MFLLGHSLISPSAPADECFYGIKKTSCLWHISHCSNTEQHAFTQTHWVYSSSLVHIPTPHTIQVLSSRSIVYIIVTQSFYASITSYLKKSVSSDYEVFGRVSISVFADADICMISQWTCLILSSLCMLFNWLICWPLKIPNTWNITVISCMQWHLIC